MHQDSHPIAIHEKISPIRPKFCNMFDSPCCYTQLILIFFDFFSILNSSGERPLTAYLIHSIPLAQSAVQIFTGDKMTVVAHLVGLEQIGYEKILGMSMGVSIFGTLDNS
jgi:hypothetical protein